MERLGNWFSRITRTILPDPMVIACGLTLLVVLAGLVTPQSSELAAMSLGGRTTAVVGMWFAGLWNPAFLVFALQMCMVLLTGYGLAKAPAATALLRFVASRVHSGRSAVLCVAAVSCAGCWINWGFGLIAAGILATELRAELKRRRIACHYALIVAGAYAGMMIWHGGLSGSAPLKVAGDGVTITRTVNDIAETVHLDPVDVTRTIFSLGNVVLSIVLVLGIPLLLRSMAKPGGDDLDHLPHLEPPAPTVAKEEAGRTRSPADWANRSRAIPGLIVLMALVALGHLISEKGSGAFDLNFVNTVFLILGLLLHRDLTEYVAAVAEGGRAITGIVIQFPLYSGIQSVMFGTGLAVAMSQAFVTGAEGVAEVLHLSAATTFPPAAFLSAGLVNLFVPSGGGQWIVQGPIMCGAADALGLPIEQTVMAVSYGDQWTNMIQPFWAIPLMGLTGVSAREFMGYCALLMLLATPVFILGLVLLF